MATYRIYSAELMSHLEMTREQVDAYSERLQAALDAEWPEVVEVLVVDRTTGAGSGLVGADDLPDWRDAGRVEVLANATLERVINGAGVEA